MPPFRAVAPQSGYAVAVNGAPVEVTRVSVKGDKVVVSWEGSSATLTAS